MQTSISRFFAPKANTSKRARVDEPSSLQSSQNANHSNVDTSVVDLTEDLGNDTRSSLHAGTKRSSADAGLDLDSQPVDTPADTPADTAADTAAVRVALKAILTKPKPTYTQSEIPEKKVSHSGKDKTKYTPLELQVVELKKDPDYNDCLLMVECGYKIRFFGDDAEKASKVLSIYAHKDHNFMVASIPTYRVYVHMQRLIAAGCKVALVRQSETAAMRKSSKASSSTTFSRKVVGIYSPSLPIEADDLNIADLLTSGRSSQPTQHASKQASSDPSGKATGTTAMAAYLKGNESAGQPADAQAGSDNEDDDLQQDEDADDVVMEEICLLASIFVEFESIPYDNNDFGAENDSEIGGSSDCTRASMQARLNGDEKPKPGGWVRVSIISLNVRSRTVEMETLELLNTPSSLELILDTLDVIRPVEVIIPENIDYRVKRLLAKRARSGSNRVAEPNEGNRYILRVEEKAVGYRDILRDNTCTGSDLPSDLSPNWGLKLEPFHQINIMVLSKHLKDVGRPALLEGSCPIGIDLDDGNGAGASDGISKSDVDDGDSTASERVTINNTPGHMNSTSTAVSTGKTKPAIRKTSFRLDPVTAKDLDIFSVTNRVPEFESLDAKHTDGYDQGEYSNSSTQPKTFGKRNSPFSGSLFGLLDHCKSAKGKAVLRSWLQHPLMCANEIRKRQDFVGWVLRESKSTSAAAAFIAACKDILHGYGDMQSELTGLKLSRLSPKRTCALLTFAMKLQALEDSYNQMQSSPTILAKKFSNIGLKSVYTVAAKYISMLDKCSAENDDYIHTLTPRARQELFMDFDGFFKLRDDTEQNIAECLKNIRAMLRMPTLEWKSLRSGFSALIEHLIELPIGHKTRIPDDWIVVNKTKQIVRYHTPEVLALQEQLQFIRDKMAEASKQAFTQFLQMVDRDLNAELSKVVSLLGELDAIFSLASVAQLPGYTKPEYESNDDDTVCITAARHPTGEQILQAKGDSFISNDVHLRSRFSERRCQVVTGPNMGGKSSYSR